MSAEADPSTGKSSLQNGHEHGETTGVPKTPISRLLVSSMFSLDLSKGPTSPAAPAKPHLFKTSNLKPKAPSMKRLRSTILSPVTRMPLESVTTNGPKKAKFQWVKGELLGKGSYAKVFLGLNATTGEIMAVKQVELPTSELEQQSSHSRKIIEALELERKTLMELDHVNVVQYLGYEETPKYLSIFLEYVPGGTICTLLRTVGGGFPEPVTKYFASQVLNGLEYLHSLGILHRDLKSDNILVEPTGICKIADFGISKKVELVDRNRARTAFKGTIFWMAPEVVDPHKEEGYDLKIDIWSAGCVVLEMWTGTRPWIGEVFWSVAAKLVEQKLAPPVPADIVLSAEASDFRSKCFQPNPSDRPTASILRQHPYLMLPPGWKYDASEFDPTRRLSLSAESRRTHVSKRSTRRHAESLGSQVEALTVSEGTIRPRTNSAPTVSGSTDYDQGGGTIRQSDNNGPPLVFITPPGTPSLSDHSETYPEDSPGHPPSDSGRSSRKSKFRGLKTYWLANPDPEPGAAPEPAYIYEPPPLPSIDEKAQYSNRLAPPAVVSAPYLPFESMPAGPSAFRAPRAEVEQFNAQVKPRFSIWSRKGKAPSRRSRNTVGTSGYGSESDDDDAFWQRPPEDADQVSDKKSARTKSSRRGTHRVSAEVDPADRPNTAAVYDNLQGFFPNCDLNMTVDEARTDGQGAEASARKKRHKKSIKIVAEEHNRLHRGQRRRTKLWDSNMEEIRAL